MMGGLPWVRHGIRAWASPGRPLFFVFHLAFYGCPLYPTVGYSHRSSSCSTLPVAFGGPAGGSSQTARGRRGPSARPACHATPSQHAEFKLTRHASAEPVAIGSRQVTNSARGLGTHTHRRRVLHKASHFQSARGRSILTRLTV